LSAPAASRTSALVTTSFSVPARIGKPPLGVLPPSPAPAIVSGAIT